MPPTDSRVVHEQILRREHAAGANVGDRVGNEHGKHATPVSDNCKLLDVHFCYLGSSGGYDPVVSHFEIASRFL